MKTFADLLDDYLDAKQEYEVAKEGSEDYYRDWFCSRIYMRFEAARENLNQAFEKISKVE